MKKVILVSALMAGLSLPAFMTASALAAEAPVTRVILSSSGLAHFEHDLAVDGNSSLQLPVRFEQVNDVLKSLVVFDAKGTLGGITLPGKQPLEQVFKDLPFSQQDMTHLVTLLNAYQGAEVKVSGTMNATGTLVNIVPEHIMLDDDRMVQRHRITVLTAEGLKTTLLEDLSTVQFTEEKVRKEIDRALKAVRENSTYERRVLNVNLVGKEKRDVTLAYVVEAPLWKTAYRMVLPEKDGDTGLLQGWAVVENTTANDWDNVDLTLVSGNPVTFRQELYESYYVQRPEIPVEVFGRVMPRVDSGAMDTAAEMERAPARQQALMKSRGAADSMRESMAFSDGMPPMATMAASPEMAQRAETGMGSVAQMSNAAQSSEATTQVLFRFPTRFDLTAGDTMMVPFVSRNVPMERVFVYQPETHATHPLAAVELTNDGDTGLPPGILTLYEESAVLNGTSFVGDAQLPVLGKGEERFVSYALDSKTSIDRQVKNTSKQGRVTISQGVMKVAYTYRSETDYTVKAPAEEERTVILEHPRQGDYKLISPDPKDVEVTKTHYRIKVPVKAGEAKTVAVVLERDAWNSYTISSLRTDDLMAYATSRGDLTPEVRKVFAELAALRRKADGIETQLRYNEQQRQTIFRDQERVRENLKALSGKSDVKDTYLDKLEEQEEQLSDLQKQKDKLSAEHAELMRDMKDYIANISL